MNIPSVVSCLYASLGGPSVKLDRRRQSRRRFRVRSSVSQRVCPGHFGNSYEVLGPNEMRRGPRGGQVLGLQSLRRLVRHGRLQGPVRLRPHLRAGRCPVGREEDQLRLGAGHWACSATWPSRPTTSTSISACPELLATKEARVFGQLICPSNPAGPRDHPQGLREPVRRPGPLGRAADAVSTPAPTISAVAAARSASLGFSPTPSCRMRSTPSPASTIRRSRWT